MSTNLSNLLNPLYVRSLYPNPILTTRGRIAFFQFNSIQFNSIQFNSIQFITIEFLSKESKKTKTHNEFQTSTKQQVAKMNKQREDRIFEMLFHVHEKSRGAHFLDL